jgi:N-acyl homoserine lactone hydrolase
MCRLHLHVLHLGYAWCDKGAIFTPGLGDGQRIRVPVPGYLIQTDRGERVLVDTGMHPVHIDDPGHTFAGTDLADAIWPEMTHEQRLEQQLALLGLSRGAITHVVNTHLHFDHCGENQLFPDVPILVQREHHTWAMEDGGAARAYFDKPDLSYTLLDGESEIFPGVRAIVAGGHVPHLMALLVEVDPAPVLMCGDAIPLQEVFTRDLWHGFADPEQARNTAYRLAEIAGSSGARMLYGHDITQWEQLPKAPRPFR